MDELVIFCKHDENPCDFFELEVKGIDWEVCEHYDMSGHCNCIEHKIKVCEKFINDNK